MKAPYQSNIKQYRIWHSPGRKQLKQVEIVEAYSGKEAQQIVRDKFPGHTIGLPILAQK